MPEPKRNGDKTDLEWESFREVIRTLYVVQDHSLEQVRNEMKERYDFAATKAQLEHRFDKWGFRKNLTKDEWGVVTYKIGKRKREHKDSEIWLNEQPMKTTKLEKAMSRYGSTSAMIIQASSPRTPDGVTIRTPVPSSPVLFLEGTTPKPMLFTSTPAGYAHVLNSPLPFMHFNFSVNSEANPHRSTIGTDNSISGATSSAFEANIIDHLLHASRGRNIPYSFHQKLNAIMPKSIFSDSIANSQMTTTHSHSSAAENFLNLTLFMMSNNFFQSKSDFNTDAYNWIKRISNEKLFEYFLSFGGPTGEALTEQIFSLAIENNDARTVENILDSGLDHSELKCSSRRSWAPHITPLERACELGHREVVRVLLDAGVDANSSTPDTRSPLGYAVNPDWDILEYKDQRDADIELIQALLSAGAKVNPTSTKSPLLMAADRCQVKVVADLLSAGADPNFVQLEGSGGQEWSITPLSEALLSKASISNIIAVVRLLLGAGASVHDVRLYTYGSRGTILEIALGKSNTQLIQILLSAGAHVTEIAFIRAVKSDMIDVINLFLSSKARVPQRAIEAAAERSNSGLFDLLLKYADPDSKERLFRRAFISAIYYGWNEKIDSFSTSGIKLQRGPALESAIASAAKRGDLSVIRLLLDKNSPNRANAVGSLGNSLYIAIANGHNEITEMLLAVGADVNYGGFTAKTPLLEAIHQKNIALSLRLLAAGARVDYPEENYTVSVLPDAVAWGNYELIQRIIGAGAEIDGCSCENQKRSLVVAVEKGDLPTIQLLMGAGADINASAPRGTGHTALAAAVRNNNLGLVRYLLANGAALDELSLIAAVSQSLEMMQVLLQARLPRYQDNRRGLGGRALRCAIMSSNSLMIEALVSSDIDLDLITKIVPHEEEYWTSNSDEWYGKESLLQTAIKFDRSDDKWIIQMLLKNGVNPNQTMKEGRFGRKTTALHSAIGQNSLQIVNMLIAAGVDVNPIATENMRRTPLQYASECGDVDITRALIEHGADVNASPYRRYGATALQYAAIHGYIGIASMLLEKGADINAQPAPMKGRTALEGASEHGRIDMLDFLLKSGALVTGPGDKQYKRARDFASENGHIAVRRLLDAHHAQQVKNNMDCDVFDTGLDNPEHLGFENSTPMDDLLDAHHAQQTKNNVNCDVFDTDLDNSEDLRFEDWMHMDEGIVDLTSDDMY